MELTREAHACGRRARASGSRPGHCQPRVATASPTALRCVCNLHWLRLRPSAHGLRAWPGHHTRRYGILHCRQLALLVALDPSGRQQHGNGRAQPHSRTPLSSVRGGCACGRLGRGLARRMANRSADGRRFTAGSDQPTVLQARTVDWDNFCRRYRVVGYIYWSIHMQAGLMAGLEGGAHFKIFSVSTAHSFFSSSRTIMPWSCSLLNMSWGTQPSVAMKGLLLFSAS